MSRLVCKSCLNWLSKYTELEKRHEDLKDRVREFRELEACYKGLQVTVEALRAALVELLQRESRKKWRWF